MAVVNDVPQLVDKKGGMEPYYLKCIKYGPFQPKIADGDAKPEAKSTESLSQTYTHYKTLLNDLANDGVNLSKHEINVCFVNSLLEKWLTFSQGLRNANHTQTLNLADISERSSKEYLRDLDIEYQERSLLANSKCFIKRRNNFSVVKTFDWDEEEVSDKEEVTQVKVLMALADDELTVGKSHACNGEWVDITIRKVNILFSMDKDADWQTYLKDELLILKQAKLNAVTFQIQNTELTKLNHALQEQLKEEKKINEKWLTNSKKVSQCISEQIPHQKKKVLGGELFTESSSKMNEKENIFVPASMGYDQEMVPKTKDWVERLNPDRLLQNFNTGRILVPESQTINESLESTKTLNTPESSKDSEAESLTPLPPLKKSLRSFTKLRENQNDVKVKQIRTDNGTEFRNHELDSFCDERGISQNFSSPYTPKQNGVAERKNKTLIGAARNAEWIGYSFISKAFRVFNTRRQHIEETYHVTFDESMMAISEQIPHQKKKVLGGELFTESSSKMNEKENIFVPASMGILVPESQTINESLESTETLNTPESSKDSEAESLTPLPPLKKSLRSFTKLRDEKVNSNQKTQESNSKIQKTKLSKSVNSSRMSQDSKPKDQNTGSSKSLRPKPIQNHNLCDHRTSDHEVYIASLKRSKNYKAQLYQYAFSSKQILKAKIRGGVLAESSQSNESSIGVKFDTCGSTVHPTTDHNEFNHFKRETHQGAHLVLGQWMLKDYDRCQELSAQICKATSLSHLNFKNINKLAKQNKVLGLPSLVYSKDKPCSACEKGKHHRASFKTKQNFSIRKCLHLLHMDLFRPVSIMSINHEKYTLVIIDEYSRERIPDINYFHVFGCPVFIHNHKDHLGKFNAKVDDGYFLGYSFVSKSFRVFNTRKQHIEETYHVTFDEIMEAIRFTHTSEDEIGINDSSRYPLDEFVHEVDPSRQYQEDSDISYYVIPHGHSLSELT
ncbi:retrovirus-related pol polyprotein from transposon TNT 1-94 [Tanacetum coccineum]